MRSTGQKNQEDEEPKRDARKSPATNRIRPADQVPSEDHVRALLNRLGGNVAEVLLDGSLPNPPCLLE